MSKINTTGIIHIAAEVIIIGGVVFYFNNQIKSLRNEVKELRQKLQDSQEIYNKHFNNIYAGLDKLVKMQDVKPIKPVKSQSKSSTTSSSKAKISQKVIVDDDEEENETPIIDVKILPSSSSSSSLPHLSATKSTNSDLDNLASRLVDDKETKKTSSVADLDRELEEELNRLNDEDEDDNVTEIDISSGKATVIEITKSDSKKAD